MTKETQIVRLSKVLCKYCHVNLLGHEQVGVASHVVLSGRNEKTDLLCCAKKFISCLFAKCCLLIITIELIYSEKKR